jgi:hypothetical protein
MNVSDQLPDPSIAGIPISTLGDAAAAVLVIIVVWIFLRHIANSRAEHNATMASIAKEFATTVERTNTLFAATMEKVATQFNTTTQQISRESRERESELHDLLREKRAS